jgi:hypothetical protein
VLRDDGDRAAFMFGNGLALGSCGLMNRLIVVIMLVMMFVVVVLVVVVAVRRLVILMRRGDGRSVFRGLRSFGLRAGIRLRRNLQRRPVVLMPIVVVMLILVMLISTMVIGVRSAEAERVIVLMRLAGMLTLVAVRLVLARLRLVAFVLVFMVVRLKGGCGTFHDLALHAIATAAAARAAVTAAAAVGAVFAFFLGFAMRALFGLDQGLTVSDRDLIIVRVNFAESEKAVAVAAIFDEGSLQRWLYSRDLGEVDVAAQLLALRGLEIKFLDAVAADDNDPGLFRVGSIDQHLVVHIGTLGGDGRSWPRARDALSDGATVHLIRG